MKPIIQTKFYEKDVSRGDCLRACIASITDLVYEDLHHSVYIDEYMDVLYDNLIGLDCVNSLDEIDSDGMNGYYIGTGPANRGVRHAVIINRNGNLIHDPHPSGDGLIRLEHIYVLSPIQVIMMKD